MTRDTDTLRPRFSVSPDDLEDLRADQARDAHAHAQTQAARRLSLPPIGTWALDAETHASLLSGKMNEHLLGSLGERDTRDKRAHAAAAHLLSPPAAWHGYHSSDESDGDGGGASKPGPPAGGSTRPRPRAAVRPKRRSRWRRLLTLPLIVGSVLVFLASRSDVRLSQGTPAPVWRSAGTIALADQVETAWNLILANIGPRAGAADGVIIASPSTSAPDYYFTWTRDASLTLNRLVPLLVGGDYYPAWSPAVDPGANASEPLVEDLVRSFIRADAGIQTEPNPSGDLYTGGLAEPKFNVNGSAYWGSWGRPQRDGPALRALALMPYAQWVLDRGFPADTQFVAQNMWDPHSVRTPGSTVKNDVEEVACCWSRVTFDLWEETEGTNLWTEALSRRALQAGVLLGTRMDDPGAAAYYANQSDVIEAGLGRYFDAERGYWVAMLPIPEGRSGLDAATLLAIVHAGARSVNASMVELSPTDPSVLATLRAFVLSFEGVYAVNTGKWTDGWLVGRYAEDIYDGVGFAGGNPWYITTFTTAEVLFLARGVFMDAGTIPLHPATVPFWADVLNKTQGEVPADGAWAAGSKEFDDALGALEGVAGRFVAHAMESVVDGHMSEQINRTTAHQQGARDLTWSYASYIGVTRAQDGILYS